MTVLRSLSILTILLALCGCSSDPAPKAAPPAPPLHPQPAAKVPLLLFAQEVCPACRQLEKQLRDPATRDEMAFFDLQEIHYPEAKKTFAEYGVKETPTLIALTPIGHTTYPGGTLGQLELWLREVRERVQEMPPTLIGKISEGGPSSPDGTVSVVCDLPAGERKKNIASRGQGCCCHRSVSYAARWQQVPELYDFPELIRDAGLPGGCNPTLMDERMKRFAPNVQYIQDTSGDPAVLEAILATGRMPCVTYNGHDGVHYSGQIAHMICLPYFNRKTGWACVSDNNFPSEKSFVWMSCEEFLQRWKGGGGSGWVVALLSPPPPPVPHN